MTTSNMNKRCFYLTIGILSMLFSGILYAWSILKVPFKEVYGWSDSALAFNFTVTMCFFCLGAFFGSLLSKRFNSRVPLILSGILVGAGFAITGIIPRDAYYILYITYGILAGTGIGISYNVIVSTVNMWFPDKKGLCSGCLMMGFGISTLLLGEIISKMFSDPAIGFKKTYIIMGIVIGIILILSGFLLKRPSKDTTLPKPKIKTSGSDEVCTKDYSTSEMIKSFTFIRAFVFFIFVTAVGNSVISFARDMVLSVGATASLATTLVGVLAIFNGVGRVITGMVYDILGRRTTMLCANTVTIVAAAITLVSIVTNSLVLCIIGLCLTGISYGSCPTITAAFTSSFYGQKHYATNYSITNFNLIFASFVANISNSLLISTGSYTAPFIMLLLLSLAALVLNFSIRRP
ncbi:MAG: OFA family MFS transporter [Ruminococcaceae bacterium]|nr:OFA family MFS transporter [Oscillospiraceae bacterium]